MVELQTPQTPSPSKLKDATLIILAIAGIALLLVIFLAMKIITQEIFYLACLVIVLYPLLKAASPTILAALQKKQATQTNGVIQHYKTAIREILAEHRSWGYPPHYAPSIAASFPNLDCVLFEVSRADVVKRGFSYEDFRNIDFEGCVLFDLSSRKITAIFEGWNYERTLDHISRNEAYFAKNPQKTYLLPLKTTETQIGLP